MSSSKNSFSTKKTTFNFQSSAKGSDLSRQTLPRRPHELHHGDESDEEETEPTHEAVTGFDSLAGGAIPANGIEEKRELVIPVTSTNNWRNRAGANVRNRPRGKNLLPKEVQAQQEAERNGAVAGGAKENEIDRPGLSYGLVFAQPSDPTAGEHEKDVDQPMGGRDEERQPIPPTSEERKPLTEDEIALKALIRESKGETEGRSDLVIESVATKEIHGEEEDSNHTGRYDETNSFRADVASRPESASLDAYNAIPVEEFGAALLRGMGWKEGQAIGRGQYSAGAPSDRANKPRIPERRPGFLGIGAKDISGGKGAEAEIGAWGKAAMRKSSRKNGQQDGQPSTEGVYMPVMMRNKKTGEFLTEEELAARRKEATEKKKDDDSWKERRDRNLERSGRDHDRDRDRDRDRESRRREHDGDDNRESRRNGSSRRERSLSSSSRHRRRRYDDDEKGKDNRHYRDRDRDYDRRDRDRERDRDRDRERDKSNKYRDDERYSSRHASSSSRHGRDRDRDSDRDSHRRRREQDR
ncbi:hypothetical protein ASPZODRAFT_134762 [Penicilliopsis zonata CBS 506.65]|uniref:Pre-mRNA-splicing factor n=1 Tax=Penicilliopsis zonata CBS 506.65 TaxID=1073090 RepID=A0A1L9SC54_9EURO|nr:hypothetical protein ASPZODRAFT_134762 [Penicilliopsis zonata CBS 506.65]OJJ44677.1 hypothetical protein ASPZODRAFT_134762 [Penicilliopsis zonata CBS 506.65]